MGKQTMSNRAQEAAPAYPATESSSEGNDAIEVQEKQPMSPQKPQPVVYVDQNGNPIVPPQEQQKVVVVTQQPAVGNQQPEEFHGDDDPQCLYVLACLGFFIPLIGAIGMCCYQCGQNLGPKQTQAFKIMAGCTIVGFIIGLLIMVHHDMILYDTTCYNIDDDCVYVC